MKIYLLLLILALMKYYFKTFGVHVFSLHVTPGQRLDLSLHPQCESGRGRHPEVPGKIRQHGHIRKRRLSWHGTSSARIRGRKASDARYPKTAYIINKQPCTDRVIVLYLFTRLIIFIDEYI